MAPQPVLDPRFADTLRRKVADYFRAQRVPELPPDIPPEVLNDPMWSDPRVRAFPKQLEQWIAFVPALFSPANCTPQFREKFGAPIDSTWRDTQILDLWNERFRSWMATWVFEDYLKKINHPGLDALEEMIEAREAPFKGRNIQGRDRNSFGVIYENYRGAVRKTVPNPPTFPFPAALQDVELYFHSVSFYIEFTRKVGSKWPGNIFPKFWESENHLVDECTRVMVRLTEKPDGALVSLWDLLDQQDYSRYLIVREIFAWVAKEVLVPVPYDTGAAVFTKVSETLALIQQLARSFGEWGADTKRN